MQSKVSSVFSSIFENSDESISPVLGVREWFQNLPAEKRDYTFSGDSAILIRKCRESQQIDESTLRSIAEEISAMDMDTWADELVLIFKGRLHSARASIDSYEPPILPDPAPPPPTDPPQPDPDPSKARISLYAEGKTYQRILDTEGELGQNGQVMENMLNAAVDHMGRSLDDRERMLVLCKFIRKYVFGESL